MDVVQAVEQILVIAGWWLALSVVTWAGLFPLLRSASRGEAAIDREAAGARPAGELALGATDRRGESPGRS
jgi:hypothetical protein